MKSFKQYIKELMGPSNAEPREGGMPNSARRDWVDSIDNRSGIQRSIDRQVSSKGVIRDTEPTTNHNTPTLDPSAGDLVRGTSREYGSGRMKIHNDGTFPHTMKNFQDMQEDKKDSGWVDQYNDADEKRIDKATRYLIKRSFRPDSKWDHMGTEYGHDSYGPNKEMQRRKISVVLTNRDDRRKEAKFSVRPDVEKHPEKYKVKKKVDKKLNE